MTKTDYLILLSPISFAAVAMLILFFKEDDCEMNSYKNHTCTKECKEKK